MTRRIVTLATQGQAKVGKTFRVIIREECTRCKLFDICVKRLRPGLLYRVVEVRDVYHYCPLLKDKMRVVVVEAVPSVFVIEKRLAVEGACLRYTKIRCSMRTCEYYERCNPPFIEEGGKLKIERVIGSVKCPRGLDLALVEALYHPPPEPQT